MDIQNKIFNYPILLQSNKAWRTYLGGKLINEWLGDKDYVDDHFPERWIASVVSARNPGREYIQKEGVSTLIFEGNKMHFDEFVMKYAEKIFGEKHCQLFGKTPGMLIKLLDSMERLAIQVHPNNQKAKELFNSQYGKTESWYILKTRIVNNEKPYILIGFKKGITRQKWQEIFESQDIQAMINSLNKFEVKEGDLWLIEGGVPHAIGPGCLILEIQEPTDYTIRVERILPNGIKLKDEAIHQGIGYNKMFECFNYEGYRKEELMNKWSIPTRMNRIDDNTIEKLITYNHTTKFALEKIEINSSITIKQNDTFSILIVYEGHGYLIYNNDSIEINKGDTILLPYCLKEIEICCDTEESMQILRCLPPIEKQYKV